EEQAEYVGDLLHRHWHAISLRLDRGYLHSPVLSRRRDEAEGRYWAGGFMRGVAARASQWGQRAQEEDMASVLGAVLAIGVDARIFPAGAAAPSDRAKIIKNLPRALVHLHCLWRGRPSSYRMVRRNETISGPRVSHKYGRNEPRACCSRTTYKRR